MSELKYWLEFIGLLLFLFFIAAFVALTSIYIHSIIFPSDVKFYSGNVGVCVFVITLFILVIISGELDESS